VQNLARPCNEFKVHGTLFAFANAKVQDRRLSYSPMTHPHTFSRQCYTTCMLGRSRGSCPRREASLKTACAHWRRSTKGYHAGNRRHWTEDVDLDKYKDCYFLSAAPTGNHNNDDDADKRCVSLQAQSLVLTSDRGCSETSETVCSSVAAFAFCRMRKPLTKQICLVPLNAREKCKLLSSAPAHFST
jgi:hypothetical protein